MYRLKEFLNSLEHYELVKLKQNLEKGTLDIGKALQEKIKENEKKHAISCTTCSNTLDPYNTNNYTLIFGPDDFRKKAGDPFPLVHGHTFTRTLPSTRGNQTMQ